MWLLLWACAPKTPEAPAFAPPTPDALVASPVLPAPEASVYATGGGTPRDLAVAAVTIGLPWDEALSGAAGALAVDSGSEPDLGHARQAAWRAGYPYPVRAVVTGKAPVGVAPEGLRDELVRSLAPGEHLGLARARVGESDRWVALIGRPVRAVPPFPSRLSASAPLPVALDGGGRYTLVSPTGQPTAGALPAAPVLAEEGEWWLQLDDAAGAPVLAVPVYVGIEVPAGPLLETPGEGATGPAAATGLAAELVGEIRAAFELAALTRDPTLDVLAQEPLSRALAGTWDRAGAASRLVSAGFPASADAAWCQGETVALCLDGMMRTAEGRQTLLGPARRQIGLAAQVDTRGVALSLVLAGE